MVASLILFSNLAMSKKLINIKRLILFSVLVIVTSCENYNYKDEDLIIKGRFSDTNESLKEGYWYYIASQTGDTLKYGEYDEGHKTGNWKYTVEDQTKTINWKIFKGNNFSINYPRGWEVIQNDDFLFYTVRDSLSGFNIVEKKLDTIPNEEMYFEEFLENLGRLNLQSISYEEKTIQDDIKVYDGNFTYLKNDSTKVSCINTILFDGNRIYESTLFQRGNESLTENDYLMQKEILYSLFIKNKPLVLLPYISDQKNIKINLNKN